MTNTRPRIDILNSDGRQYTWTTEDKHNAILKILLSKLNPEILRYIFASYLQISPFLKSQHARIVFRKLNSPRVSIGEKLLALQLAPLLIRYINAEEIHSISILIKSVHADVLKPKAVTALLFALEYGVNQEVRQAAFDTYTQEEWQHTDFSMTEKAFASFAGNCLEHKRTLEMSQVCLAHNNYVEAEILYQRSLKLQEYPSKQPEKPIKEQHEFISKALAERRIGKILTEFQSWLSNSKIQLSTRRVYSSRFKQFVKFAESHRLNFNDSKDDFINLSAAYIAFVTKEQSLKANSVNNTIALLRLIAKKAGLKDTYFEMQSPERTEGAFLNTEEQESYINAARLGNSSRDLLLALVFLKTNIRLGEAINIKVSDLIWEASELKISIVKRTGKRLETLDKATRQAVQSWLMERAQLKSAGNSDYLFPGGAGGKITSASIDTALRKIGWRARLNISARVLRKSHLNTKRCEKNLQHDGDRPRKADMPNIASNFGTEQKPAQSVQIYRIAQ